MYTSRVAKLAAGRSQKANQKSALLNISKRSTNASFNNSHIFEETGNYIVEGYGVSLPVLVAEALSSSDRSCTSVKLSENGWCWLVSGRRLFIWKYKLPSGSKSAVSYCKELTLPSSDLAHKAELVSVHAVNSDGSIMVQPTAVAVSPEGLVRYWPSIAHDGSYFETSAELHGQECFSLTDIQPFGCILATTTSSLVLISTKNISGHNNIQCQNLRAPQGMLGGISRRVSSFIFGSIPSQTNECKLAKVLACDGADQREKTLFVLSGQNLQKWTLFDYQSEQIVYECDLDRIARETSASEFWGQDSSRCNEIRTWLIDMQFSRDGLIVLVGALNTSSQMVHFALGCLDTKNELPPTSFSQFNILRYSILFSENEDLVQRFNLICPSADCQSVYIYQEKMILCISGADEPYKIEFRAQSDRILGAGTCQNLPLLFISSQGIASIVNNQQADGNTTTRMDESVLLEPTNLNLSTLNMSLIKMDGEPSQQDGKTAKLKAALIHYIKHDIQQCEEVINECFPVTGIDSADSSLDTAACRFSEEMIDDFPASDPRWMETHNKDVCGSSGSLIILRYLEGKQDAYKYFMTFLKGTDLYDKLQWVTVGNELVHTKQIIAEHLEKLVAAIALRAINSDTPKVLDDAIKKVVEDRSIRIGNLTPQDHFYRQVSNIDDVVNAMIEVEMQSLNSDVPVQECVNTIATVNMIIEETFQAVLKYRRNKAIEVSLMLNHQELEMRSTFWTNSEGKKGMRNSLIKQYFFTIEHAVKLTDDEQTKGLILQQMVDLADIILDGYATQLEYLRKNEEKYNTLNIKYIDNRYRLLGQFLELKQPDRAAALAEKYHDFKILVQLCDAIDDQGRLQRYMLQFANEGFTDFVFKWYLDEGKRGKLLKNTFSQSRDLSKFLSIHPNLSWVNHIETESYSKAHSTLCELADQETEYLSRKKTLLSIGKLASAVSDKPNDQLKMQIKEIENKQNLILYQETLPRPVLENLGIDPDAMRVLSPQELIKLYISEENSNANEYDFKKALDLLQYISPSRCEDEEETTSNLRLLIFCHAILRDRWSDLDTSKPIEELKKTIFFKLIDLAFTSRMDLEDFLPPTEALLEREELSQLSQDSSFQFLLQAGYEYISQFVI